MKTSTKMAPRVKTMIDRLPKLGKLETFGANSSIIGKLLNIILGILLLVIAHFAARISQRAVVQTMQKQRIAQDHNSPKDSIADRVVGLIVYWVIVMIAIVVVLRSLGIETASIIAVLGSIGFALGLAMQGALGDLTAGVILSVGVGFSVGDMIEVDNISGIVEEFNLLYTTIKSNNSGHFIKIPNRVLYGNVMHNHTRNPTHGVMLQPVIANVNKNVDGLCQKIEEALMQHPRVLKSPPVHAQVGSIEHLGTTLNIRVSIKGTDYPTAGNWNVGDELMQVVRNVFNNNNVILPDKVNVNIRQ